jgi:Bacterial Ig domain
MIGDSPLGREHRHRQREQSSPLRGLAAIFAVCTLVAAGALVGFVGPAFSVQSPTTSVLVPSNGATVSGTSVALDASASSGTIQVHFVLDGGTVDDATIGVVNTESIWGWAVTWNSTTVPNGTYTLQSVASALGDNNGASTTITITVNNPLPTTSVLVPSNGAIVSGANVTLDASASPNPAVTNVSFYLSSSPSFSYPILIGTVTAESYYGWATTWNSAAITEGDYTVGDGTYYLESVAAYSGGTSGTSGPITITVNNPPVTLLPSDNATVSGTVLLDMSVPSGTTYGEWFLGLNGIFQGYLVASPSAYGWYLEWNSTTVSNGDYTLEPVAVVGSADILNGSSITIDVNNP